MFDTPWIGGSSTTIKVKMNGNRKTVIKAPKLWLRVVVKKKKAKKEKNQAPCLNRSAASVDLSDTNISIDIDTQRDR